MTFKHSILNVWAEPAGKAIVGTAAGAALASCMLGISIGTATRPVSTAAVPVPIASYSPPAEQAKLGMPNEQDFRKVDLLIADSASYYTKPVTIKAVVSPDDYYNYAFANTEGTHYSFEIEGADSNIYAYGERSKFKDLFDYLASHGGRAPVQVTIQTSPQHEDNAIWSILSWKKI